MLPLDYQIAFTLLILAGVVFAFIRESVPAHLVAIGAMVLLLLTGVITTEQALSVFANPAPVTIACMFVIAAALERTGVMDAMGRAVLRLVDKKRKAALIVILGGVILISAFVNNTPVVMVMAPVVIAVANRLKDSPSRFLLPLAYAAILGGTCTMIGTSTNLLVDGVGRTLGQPAFTMFEITGPGLLLAATGATFMLLFSHRLLPARPAAELESGPSDKKHYIAEALIPQASPLIGKTLNEVIFSASGQYEIVDLIRDESSDPAQSNFIARFKSVLDAPQTEPNRAHSALRDLPLKAGDRLLFKTDRSELLEIKQHIGITFATEDMPQSHAFAEAIATREVITAEGVIGADSAVIGRRTGELRLRRRFGCYILAIHRGTQNITSNFSQIELQNGDLLLLEGPRDELEKLFEHFGILSLSQARRHSFDQRRAPLAIFVLCAVVVLSAMGLMPIAGLALAGATFLVLSGCITAERAYAAIQWRVLLLIFGMLGISAAMDSSGTAKLIVEGAAAVLSDFGPLAMLAMVYTVSSLLTEIMSNNAVALLLTSIAIGLAESMGVDPRPFMVAVMFGASASVATPVGYQVNSFIYTVGNYTFGDFLRFGIPMKILMLIATLLVIPLFWDIQVA
jgi:di/tricarboxylate transporter